MEDLTDASVRLKIWQDKTFKTNRMKNLMADLKVGMASRLKGNSASDYVKRRTMKHASTDDRLVLLEQT